MRTKPRGRVLLFNNFVSAEHSVKEGKERKVKLSRREGTDLDEKALRCLLDQLHFDIEVKKDRTAQVQINYCRVGILESITPG